ncbi:uncharacterized protein LOC142803292 isoform X2 [Rhipicephalus microplus]|uniref:uncharacterized protein LOC142803292 isoform X2 n=1 Tax=Rhipicephalus microplus TaxID=6941 RepID=UPI003F6A925F
MAFKACITAIAVAYVVQTLCGADSSSESSGSGSSDEDTVCELHVGLWPTPKRQYAVCECHRPDVKLH